MPLGIIAYVAIALMPPPTGSLETFPFFNWSLFSNTSDRKNDVVVVIQSIDGQPLPQPAFFYDMKDRFMTARTKDTRFAKTLDRLAFSILSDNETIEQRTREIVEKFYMRESQNIEYSVVIITYNPIERYRTGKIDKTLILRTYTKNV